MNKLSKASILKGRDLHFVQDTLFEGYPMAYPLLGVKKCHYTVRVSKVGDYSHADFTISATLRVEDSRDAVAFDKKVNVKESIDILDVEDEEGEGYLVEGGDIDLDDLALKILHSSLPIRLVRPESALPKNGQGYRVLSEEEKEKEKAEAGNPAFASLADYPVKK